MNAPDRRHPPLRIGIVSVRDADYHPNRRLLEAARAAGHTGVLIHPYRRWPVTRNGRSLLTGHQSDQDVDVVLPRQGAEISDACLALLRQFQNQGVPLVNGAAAVAVARNKYYTLQTLTAAGLPCPATALVNDGAGFPRAVDHVGGYPVVVKPVSGRQGDGVMLITNADDIRQRALPSLDRRRGMMVQRYLPPDGRQDIRALVIGGRLACAVQLTPQKDDFRANVHLGSQVRATVLSHELGQIAVQSATAIGLDVAGVDLLVDADNRPLVVEVNYAPGFRGLERATGLDIAGRIIDHAAHCMDSRPVSHAVARD